jgi:hypothetical protein
MSGLADLADYISSPHIRLIEGAVIPCALVVQLRILAGGMRVFHLDPEFLAREVHGLLDGQVAHTLAASRSPHLADG